MAANNIIALTQENFATEVLQASTPVLVDFWAQWCNPCRALTPILDELAEEYDGRVKIGKVNTDDQQSLAVQYSITAIPTLLLFHQGQVVDQVRGLKSKRDLKETLDRVTA
jgi:thioredoxin 1